MLILIHSRSDWLFNNKFNLIMIIESKYKFNIGFISMWIQNSNMKIL